MVCITNNHNSKVFGCSNSSFLISRVIAAKGPWLKVRSDLDSAWASEDHVNVFESVAAVLRQILVLRGDVLEEMKWFHLGGTLDMVRILHQESISIPSGSVWECSE